MKLTITIEMDNAAFFDNEAEGIDRDQRCAETTRILNRIIDGIQDDGIKLGYSWPVRDSNGNTVGKAEVTA